MTGESANDVNNEFVKGNDRMVWIDGEFARE
jgi:hypothetical protein